jgi:hypothetical protein
MQISIRSQGGGEPAGEAPTPTTKKPPSRVVFARRMRYNWGVTRNKTQKTLVSKANHADF